MVESTFPSKKASLKRKAIIMLSISTMTTMSSASIFMIQDAEASRVGLRVLVHGGEGNVCVESSNENAGCEFADGGTLEFEFSPDAVEVGDTFSVCDSNGCETGRNGEEKAPEHVYLGGGGGGSSDGDSSGNEDDLAQELCDLLDENRLAAAAIAVVLGYPGLDQAASALCGVTGN